MFNDMSVVTTAVSSFNNAALYSPFFFVVGLFSVPLFFMVYLYGRDFISKLGWNSHNMERKISFWTVTCLVLWLMIFGGNYAVIRDSISLLPAALAFVLFVSMVYITNQAKKMGYMEKLRDKKTKWFVLVSLIVLAVFSAKPTWWGILLQLSAVFCGAVVGDRLNKKYSVVSVSTVVLSYVSILVLMQPEFFRFGQLGNLTLMHILAILLCGFFGITTLVTKYTNARSKIHQSAYIKLKWLFRISAILGLILFVFTESVPVCLGMLGAVAVLEMLNIYHGKALSEKIYQQSWGLLMVLFGLTVICPAITLFGLLYLVSLPEKIQFKDFAKLL